MSTLIHADCFDILSQMESGSIDMTFTSVPFKPEDMGLTYSDYWLKMDILYKELCRVTSKVICIIQSASNLNEYVKRYNPKRTLIWGKGQLLSHSRYNPIFVHQISDEFKVNAYIWSDVFGVPPLLSKQKKHPYQDPLKLYETIITMFNKKSEIRTVIDPFMGSGTAGVACANLGIGFTGIEIDDDFYQTAQKRIITYEDDNNVQTTKHQVPS